MVRKILMIACLGVAGLLPGTSLAGDVIVMPPTSAGAQPGQTRAWQVNVYRLKHADASRVAKELSSIVDADKARLVADARTNSLVVAATPEAQKSLDRLIPQLDVRQGQGSPGPASQPGESAEKQPGPTSGRAVTAASGTTVEPPAFAVVRASPELRKALEELAAKSGRTVSGDLAAKSQGKKPANDEGENKAVEALHVRSIKSPTLAKALDEILPKKTEKGQAMAVIGNVPPDMQKAIEGLAARRGGNAGTERSHAAGTAIRVIRIPGGNVEALEEALTQAARRRPKASK